MAVLLLIGLIGVIWCSIEYMHYPGMREIRREAFRSIWWQEAISMACLIGAYILTFSKKK